MLFLQTCADLTGTSPQDVATVAGNIRTAAEKGLVAPGRRHKALVEFPKGTCWYGNSRSPKRRALSYEQSTHDIRISG